ncbi:hypothetical protein GGS21DRAFT_517175 [Xylaria nigripes]|nr:hypothetical protein GGS21DRAFT_517175 [Xylaria nigripes]
MPALLCCALPIQLWGDGFADLESGICRQLGSGFGARVPGPGFGLRFNHEPLRVARIIRRIRRSVRESRKGRGIPTWERESW